MEADLGLTEQAMSDTHRYKGDEHLYVKFFNHPLQDKEKTLEEGRPIFVDREFIQIMVPGDKDNIVTREIRETDKQRFPKQWAAFQNDQEELVEGTPLSQWPIISAAQIEEMKYFGVKTVEQLANVSDSASQKFMGIQLLKRRAKEYIEAAKDAAPVAILQGELEKRDELISGLEASMEEMQKELAKLKKAKK